MRRKIKKETQKEKKSVDHWYSPPEPQPGEEEEASTTALDGLVALALLSDRNKCPSC
jgi:hypothetical protein